MYDALESDVHQNGKNNSRYAENDYFDKALLKRPDFHKAQAQKLYQKAQICDWKTIQQDKELFSTLGTSKNHIPPFTMLFFQDEPRNHYLRSKLYAKKKYLQKLWNNRESFSDFEITIEATHHGPTHLKKPSIFVEIGTTDLQWNDEKLCSSVAQLVLETLEKPSDSHPFAICFGGTHYSEKFTKELLFGKYALGTVMPKHALEFLNPDLFEHIITQNNGAEAALLDWKSLGKQKQTLIDLLSTSKLEVIKI